MLWWLRGASLEWGEQRQPAREPQRGRVFGPRRVEEQVEGERHAATPRRPPRHPMSRKHVEDGGAKMLCVNLRVCGV
jgi:hypothetical protein